MSGSSWLPAFDPLSLPAEYEGMSSSSHCSSLIAIASWLNSKFSTRGYCLPVASLSNLDLVYMRLGLEGENHSGDTASGIPPLLRGWISSPTLEASRGTSRFHVCVFLLFLVCKRDGSSSSVSSHPEERPGTELCYSHCRLHQNWPLYLSCLNWTAFLSGTFGAFEVLTLGYSV